MASGLAVCQLRRRALQSSRQSLHGQHRPDTGLSHVEEPEHSGRAVFEPSPAARDSASAWAQQSFLQNHQFWDTLTGTRQTSTLRLCVKHFDCTEDST